METIILTPRNNYPPEVFKAIRVVGISPNRFNGHLRYKRIMYPDYNYHKGDILDEKILNSIKGHFPNSYFNQNVLALYDKQYEDFLIVTRGGATKSIIIYFVPIPNYEGKNLPEIKSYYINLELTLWLEPGSKNLEFIPSEMLVNIPQKDLENLINSIESV